MAHKTEKNLELLVRDIQMMHIYENNCMYLIYVNTRTTEKCLVKFLTVSDNNLLVYFNAGQVTFQGLKILKSDK